MSDDLVRRLRDANAHSTQRIFGSDIFDEAATALSEARAEIERRDAFIKELSDALRSIRPLGGSELFVKRFGNYYADPVYCKAAIENRTEEYHNAMKAHVRARKQADALKSELSTLRARVREVVGPFAEQADGARLCGAELDDDWKPFLHRSYTDVDITNGHLRAARQLMEEVK